MPRNRDTSAAVAARVRTKHERWAAEMREAGWGVLEPEKMVILNMPLKDAHWMFEWTKK